MPWTPPVAENDLTVSGSNAVSNAFNASTRMIRVHTDTTCKIVIGADPNASTAGGAWRMKADQTEYFYVQAGHKIACVSAT